MSDSLKTSTERVRKKKPGRVVRLTPDLVRLVDLNRRKGETLPSVLRRLFLREEGNILYALPSDLYESVEDARGAAILKAIKVGSAEIERPLRIKRAG